MLREPSVAMIEDLTLDVAQPIADSGVDQDSVAALHYKRAGQVEADTVALVGRMVALPEFARHDAEHASAVIAPQPVGEERDGESADFDLWRCAAHCECVRKRSCIRKVAMKITQENNRLRGGRQG